MPSRRDLITMTEAEIGAFLDEERTITVASINADGTPHLTAMWFAYLEGTIRFWTFAKSQKVVNLRRDPRASVLCEAGETYEELRGVSITGPVDVIDDRDQVLAFGMAVHARYWGETGDEAETRAAVEAIGAKRALVVVHPERIATWDHRKLGGTY